MQLVQVFLVFLVCACSTINANGNFCEKLLRELADDQSKAVYCATMNSVPVTLCTQCVVKYRLMEEGFNKLMQNETCAKEYLDTDRINIVSSTQGALTGLWNKANCDDCNKGDIYDKFQAKWSELDKCLEQKHDVCSDCVYAYTDLNSFYILLDKKSNGKVCYDMQDSMNRTRVNWSKKLKCCQREVQLTNFLISACCTALLPIILFYGGAVLLTRRREANHGILNEQEPELDAPSTSTLITAAVLATATAAENDLRKIAAENEQIAELFAAAAEDSGAPKKPSSAET